MWTYVPFTNGSGVVNNDFYTPITSGSFHIENDDYANPSVDILNFHKGFYYPVIDSNKVDFASVPNNNFYETYFKRAVTSTNLELEYSFVASGICYLLFAIYRTANGYSNGFQIFINDVLVVDGFNNSVAQNKAFGSWSAENLMAFYFELTNDSVIKIKWLYSASSYNSFLGAIISTDFVNNEYCTPMGYVKKIIDNIVGSGGDVDLTEVNTKLDTITTKIGIPIVDLSTDISNVVGGGGEVDLTPVTAQLTTIEGKIDNIPTTDLTGVDTKLDNIKIDTENIITNQVESIDLSGVENALNTSNTLITAVKTAIENK